MIELDIHKVLYGSQGEMKLDVALKIDKGEFIALMGESGSGKTTLLRILAGLEVAEGSIVVDAISWQGMPVQKREIGFVFQDYALFDNMTVKENLLFVNDDKSLADELLEMTALTVLKNRNVTGLSGGQKQRVALCRAMMKKPRLLLMDEPLSALDPVMRKTLQEQIKVLHQRFDMTTLMVSHDTREVYTLASRVCVLEQGKIVKDGPVKEVLKDNDTQKVEVLELVQNLGKTIATISYHGELLDIEVAPGTKLGEKIDIHIKAEQI